MNDSDKIKLISSNDEEFEVSLAMAEMFGTVKNMLEDLGGGNDFPIPLPNVNSATLSKIIEYCEYELSKRPKIEEETADTTDSDTNNSIIEDEWHQEYINSMDQAVLFEVILGANYLELKSLLDLCCKGIANMIKGKTPEEIRKTFNIKNDFTPEEEEQVRRENEW